NVIRELLNLHAVLVDQGLERARIIGLEIRSDLVIFGLADILDERLQVLRKLLIFRLVDHQFGRKARLDEAREVVVLCDLIEAKRQIIVGTDEFRSVKRAGLQSREDFACGHAGDGRAELLPYAAAQARSAEADALDRFDAGQLVAEPAARLRARVARQEALHAELVIDLVPDLLAAEIAHPGGELARGHAVRHAGEE